METLVAPQAAAAAAEMLRDVTDNTARVEKYSARLRELRQRRSDMQVLDRGQINSPWGGGGGCEFTGNALR